MRDPFVGQALMAWRSVSVATSSSRLDGN